MITNAHWGSNTVSYKFSGLSSAYKEMFRDAAEIWESCTSAHITESSSAVGTVTKENIESIAPGCPAITVTPMNVSSPYHGYTWTIYMNSTRMNELTAVSLAHEIGHVFGLVDLYNSSNINKLMHFSEYRTATAPTSSDVKGFNVITGLHTNVL